MARKRQNLRLSNSDVLAITQKIADLEHSDVLAIAKEYGWSRSPESELTEEQQAMAWANSIRNKWRDNVATSVLVKKCGIAAAELNATFRNREKDVLVERGENEGSHRRKTKSEFLADMLNEHYDGGETEFDSKFDQQFPGPKTGARGKKADFAKAADAAEEFAMAF